MTEPVFGSAVDTVVIGAGQAGLVASRLLTEAGREHVVLERRDKLGGGWLDRWDSFCLVTPNWACQLAGYGYDGSDPDGFMVRDDIVAFVTRFARSFDAPVVLGTEVLGLERSGSDGAPVAAGGRFLVRTNRGAIQAANVVVAAGGFQRPNIPSIAAGLSPRITQVHSHAYRNEPSLPPGGVLVVGSGQSGGQIAEELQEAGRQVFLCVGSSGTFPRRYRGRDIFWWFFQRGLHGPEVGMPVRTVADLPSPQARWAANPTLSGKHGGHDIDPRRLGEKGVTLLGRLTGIEGERVAMGPDLEASLAMTDRFFDDRFRPDLDRYIGLSGAEAPPDDREPPSSFRAPIIETLDLRAAGISTVVWTTGYRLNFGWIDFPIFDDMGYPRHVRGVSEVPGLYFLGLPWLHTQISPTFLGVTADASHVVSQLNESSTATTSI